MAHSIRELLASLDDIFQVNLDLAWGGRSLKYAGGFSASLLQSVAAAPVRSEQARVRSVGRFRNGLRMRLLPEHHLGDAPVN